MADTPPEGLRANIAQFSLLVLVNALVGAMVGMERSILPALAEQRYGVEAASGILSFILVFGTAKALANYAAGRWAESFGKKRMLVAGWLIAVPVPFLLMVAPTWGWVMGANLLLGVSQGLSWSATVIMKIDLAGVKHRGLAMGLNEFAGYLAVAASAFATATIADRWGLQPQPFYLGVAYVIFGLGLSALVVRDTRPQAQAEIARQPRVVGNDGGKGIFWRTTWFDRELSSATQAGLVNNLNDGMVWGLFPIVFAASGLGMIDIGWLVALYPSIWGLTQLFSGALSDRVGRKPLIVGGMVLQAFGIATVAGGSSWPAFVVGQSLLGIGTGMVYPTLIASIVDVAPAVYRAAAVGVYRLWRDLGYAFGAILSGLLADYLGISWAIWGVALLTLASGLVVAIRMRETRVAGPVPLL